MHKMHNSANSLPSASSASPPHAPAAASARDRKTAQFALSIGGPTVAIAVAALFAGDARWNNIPLHSVMESLGLFAGVMLALLLRLLRRYDNELSNNLWLLCGLLSMGILDGFHAAVTPGNSFVWLHSVATFCGGTFFAMVWLPTRRIAPRSETLLMSAVVGATILLGTLSLNDSPWIPRMVVAGEFTAAANFLNVAGGLGFMASAIWFARRRRRMPDKDPFYLTIFAFYFGAAGLVFFMSQIWDPYWWLWHVLRVIAYVAVLGEILGMYKKSQEDLQGLNSQLEEKVAARVAELSASESHTRAIVENTAEGIITINADGRILSFNPAAERLFAYPAATIIGQPFSQLLQDTKAEFNSIVSYDTTDKTNVAAAPRELEARRRDGTPLSIELSLSRTPVTGGAVYTCLVRDITERKKIERMKDEFIASVSHELRTPLTAITGTLRLLSGGVCGDFSEKTQQMIDIASRNGQRLATLVDDLLDLEKAASGKLRLDIQPTQLRPLLVQAIEANRMYGANRNVHLELAPSAANAQVCLDNQRFMQVMANLISNAIKFSPDGAGITINSVIVANTARISVRDHGPGIPEEFRERIFQRFAQADSSSQRQRGGTGLGLAITRELVERMDGSLSFESEEGRGTTFFVDLPLAKPSDAAFVVNALSES